MRRPFTVVGIVSLLVTQTPTQLQESRASVPHASADALRTVSDWTAPARSPLRASISGQTAPIPVLWVPRLSNSSSLHLNTHTSSPSTPPTSRAHPSVFMQGLTIRGLCSQLS